VLQNKTLDCLIYKNMKEILPVSYTEKELLYAEKFKAVGAVEEFGVYEGIVKKIFGEANKEKLNVSMAQFVFPPMDIKMGSSDVGDVSWNVPTAWFNLACYSLGTSVHSWQLVAQGRSSIAHKGMTAAATILAMTAIDIIEDPSIAQKAKKDLINALNGQHYKSVIPAFVKADS
jgi:aminobenzoyl-glutamate utilization protein B